MDTNTNTVAYSKKIVDTELKESDTENIEEKVIVNAEKESEKVCDTAECTGDKTKDSESKDSVYTDAESGVTSQEEEVKEGDNGRVLLEVKPFEGSTDTLTGDLAQTQSAKGIECESERTDKSYSTTGSHRFLSPANEVNIKTLIESATVSTSTTDISDSSVNLQHALVLQPAGAGHVGLSTTMTRPGGSAADSNILSLHIPEGRNGAGRTLDLLVCNPPSLQQTAAAGESILLHVNNFIARLF